MKFVNIILVSAVLGQTFSANYSKKSQAVKDRFDSCVKPCIENEKIYQNSQASFDCQNPCWETLKAQPDFNQTSTTPSEPTIKKNETTPNPNPNSHNSDNKKPSGNSSEPNKVTGQKPTNDSKPSNSFIIKASSVRFAIILLSTVLL